MAKQPTVDDYMKSGAIRTGTDDYFDIRRLPCGIPQLDRLLGGGFPYGRNALIVGPESTGKTLLSQYLVAAAQREGKLALLVDAEHSFDRSWWAATGVDVSKLLISQPTVGEEAVNIITSLIRAQGEDLGVVVLDSIATLTPTTIVEKMSGERVIAGLANLVTDMYAKIMPINHHTVFVAINQLRVNMGGYDDIFPGGTAQRFNSHLRLHTRRVGWITERDQRVGYTMEIHVRKNKVGGQSETACEVPVRFDSQMDLMMSYIDEAIDRGIITSGGPWYTYEGERVLGKDNLRNLVLDRGFDRLKDTLEGRAGVKGGGE